MAGSARTFQDTTASMVCPNTIATTPSARAASSVAMRGGFGRELESSVTRGEADKAPAV